MELWADLRKGRFFIKLELFSYDFYEAKGNDTEVIYAYISVVMKSKFRRVCLWN